MGLSNEERRRLDELAGLLAREDPGLSRALTDGQRTGRHGMSAADHHRLRWVAALLMAVSMPLGIVGLIIEQPVLFAAGALALVAGPALVIVAKVRQRSPA